jgi:chloride channel protein, CIC family
MGAVFTSAARAPLTSLASVVEMTGDFSLTLPVMLAVAIASTVSRALSYGTIYTSKLLRRGTDIDKTTPWRALQDLKIADAMRAFHPSLAVPPGEAPDGNADGTAPDWVRIAGPVTGQQDPQSVFATESLAQALRQLEVYGHDGLPVLSPTGSRSRAG